MRRIVALLLGGRLDTSLSGGANRAACRCREIKCFTRMECARSADIEKRMRAQSSRSLACPTDYAESPRGGFHGKGRCGFIGTTTSPDTGTGAPADCSHNYQTKMKTSTRGESPSPRTACSVAACHCGGMIADYIIGPMANGRYYPSSRLCAEMHLMAGYGSRSLTPENAEKYLGQNAGHLAAADDGPNPT